ncbi:hypothetical protein HHK36_005549 [Tetracentron sinense]|uniref:Phytocyanin domain-containing protein n=1 Tax=Tetracentron sinense TaxID=13715 RepID=A0A835DME9_TETSI|nr:hypothetical protein HHK36_005549 [Tetracentron sinense]
MAMVRILMSLTVVAVLVISAMAANLTVGGSNGAWDTTTNLQAWATSQTFSSGDNLIFQYTPNHSVLEVTKADYDSCQMGNPLQIYMGGTTIVPLSSPGKRYFICGTSGHCTQGMKLEVDIIAASAPPPASPVAPPPTSPPPITSTSPPTTSTPPSTPSPTLPPSRSPSPKTAPSKSPSLTPSKSPSTSPTSSPPIPYTESPMVAPSGSPTSSPSPSGSEPSPSPSSANKGHLQASFTMGFSFGMMMLLAL